MMSWLSLLLHEKEAVEATTQAAPESDCEVAGLPAQSRVRACLHGIAEDLVAAGSAGSGNGSMRLEVCGSLGVSAGHLRPASDSKPGRYVLARQGETVLDIEAKSEKSSILLSKQGEVVAMATHLGTRRNPEEPPEPAEEDEHLQVDIKEGADLPEIAMLLTCALSMIVFKPKASTRKEDHNLVDSEVYKEANLVDEEKEGVAGENAIIAGKDIIARCTVPKA